MTFPRNKDASCARSVAGFTLTEMLVTTLILSLVATLMATGIPVAIDTYQKIVKTSNAQLALSTTVSSIKSELGLATDGKVVAVSTGGESSVYKIYYYSLNEGCWISIGNPEEGSGPRGLVKQYYKGLPTAGTDVEDLEPDGDGIPIVSNETIAVSNEATTDALQVVLTAAMPEGKIDEEVGVKIEVRDKAGNKLASVGDEDDQGYRILTRFAE